MRRLFSLRPCSSPSAPTGRPRNLLARDPIGRFTPGDQGRLTTSPLRDIHRGNVGRLTPAWTWKPDEGPLKEYGTQPGNFQNTPLMIDNVLYVSTPYNRVVALEARTGRELWRYDPEPFKDGQPPQRDGLRAPRRRRMASATAIRAFSSTVAIA